MKKVYLFIVAILLLASCAKQVAVEEPTDKWNGYFSLLKNGEMVHTLWAGRHINVGTVTYGVNDDGSFYATYDCSASGWKISETHMFADDKALLPLNKPGNPKVGQFPNSNNHNPWVSTYTYTLPLVGLPPYEQPGFVVSSHCIVHSPQGKTETAWAEGDFKFTDKDWGWYDTYYYKQEENEYTILYGIEFSNDSLSLVHLNMTNGTCTIIFKEFVDSPSGSCDGAAYDVNSGMFFWVNNSSGEIMVNNMNDSEPSVSEGLLIGTANSGTFFNNAYYYVDATQNTINKVTFNTDWSIATEMVISTIPGSVDVTDISWNLDGSVLYMVGQVSGGQTQLITWEWQTDTYSTMTLTDENGNPVVIPSGVQIAYGSDGMFYAIAPIEGGGGSTMAYWLDVQNGSLTEIGGGIEPGPDPTAIISDISSGPIM